MQEWRVTDACPSVMVLKTLKIITPIGFPGIMKPAKNGERTLRAIFVSFRQLYGRCSETYKVECWLCRESCKWGPVKISQRASHGCNRKAARTINTAATMRETKNAHPLSSSVLQLRMNSESSSHTRKLRIISKNTTQSQGNRAQKQYGVPPPGYLRIFFHQGQVDIRLLVLSSFEPMPNLLSMEKNNVNNRSCQSRK